MRGVEPRNLDRLDLDNASLLRRACIAQEMARTARSVGAHGVDDAALVAGDEVRDTHVQERRRLGLAADCEDMQASIHATRWAKRCCGD